MGMKIHEAITRIRQMDAKSVEDSHALRIACDIMNEEIDRRNPKPIRFSDLVKYKWLPVWIEAINEDNFGSKWVIIEIFVFGENSLVCTTGGEFKRSDYGETWLAYRSRPRTEL